MVVFSVGFGHGSPVVFSSDDVEGYRWTSVHSKYTTSLCVLEAKLNLISDFYHSRFGHKFDFDLLLKGNGQ